MTQIEWHLFKDKVPNGKGAISKIVYVTDLCSVWVSDFSCEYSHDAQMDIKCFAENNPNYAWAEIPIPPVPEKPEKQHLCQEGNILCWKDQYGLFLACRYHTDSSRYEVKNKVKYCPFCGFKAED